MSKNTKKVITFKKMSLVGTARAVKGLNGKCFSLESTFCGQCFNKDKCLSGNGIVAEQQRVRDAEAFIKRSEGKSKSRKPKVSPFYVKCVDDANSLNITVGRQYLVVGEDPAGYILVGDYGLKCIFPKILFTVEPLQGVTFKKKTKVKPVDVNLRPNFVKALKDKVPIHVDTTPEISKELQNICNANEVFWIGHKRSDYREENSFFVRDTYKGYRMVLGGDGIRYRPETDTFDQVEQVASPKTESYPNLRKALKDKKEFFVKCTPEFLAQLNSILGDMEVPKWVLNAEDWRNPVVVTFACFTETYSTYCVAPVGVLDIYTEYFPATDSFKPAEEATITPTHSEDSSVPTKTCENCGNHPDLSRNCPYLNKLFAGSVCNLWTNKSIEKEEVPKSDLGMTGKCHDNFGLSLTLGKQYKILEVTESGFIIKNDLGNVEEYKQNRFEPLESVMLKYSNTLCTITGFTEGKIYEGIFDGGRYLVKDDFGKTVNVSPVWVAPVFEKLFEPVKPDTKKITVKEFWDYVLENDLKDYQGCRFGMCEVCPYAEDTGACSITSKYPLLDRCNNVAMQSMARKQLGLKTSSESKSSEAMQIFFPARNEGKFFMLNLDEKASANLKKLLDSNPGILSASWSEPRPASLQVKVPEYVWIVSDDGLLREKSSTLNIKVIDQALKVEMFNSYGERRCFDFCCTIDEAYALYKAGENK